MKHSEIQQISAGMAIRNQQVRGSSARAGSIQNKNAFYVTRILSVW
jgi:hypothetical protein